MTDTELFQLMVQKLFEIASDGSDDTAEMVAAITTLTDGELGNNDLETILMYDDENSVYTEISSKLDVIDTRLDWTNKLLSEGFSFVCTFAVLLVAGKFFNWLFRVVGV